MRITPAVRSSAFPGCGSLRAGAAPCDNVRTGSRRRALSSASVRNVRKGEADKPTKADGSPGRRLSGCTGPRRDDPGRTGPHEPKADKPTRTS
jgi:hypothetical protein